MSPSMLPFMIVLTLVGVAPPAGSAGEPPASRGDVRPIDTREAFDLGGPCDESGGLSVGDFYSRLREAKQREDPPLILDLYKQYVRAMCSNHNRWYDLAAVYLAEGRAEPAIQVLEEVHRRGGEIKSSTFRYRESLARFIETPEFRQSDLGRELDRLRREAERRKESHRARLDALDPSSRPPQSHVAEGACPFECCTYRDWQVKETTPLYDTPSGTVVVGTAVKGHTVRGVTGDVHVRPAPVAVLHDHPPFALGEIIFLLDYVGEGVSRYWRNGAIAEDDLSIEEVCLRPGRACWAEFIEAAEERQAPRWWILIETEDGARGWTDQPDNFGNKDACG